MALNYLSLVLISKLYFRNLERNCNNLFPNRTRWKKLQSDVNDARCRLFKKKFDIVGKSLVDLKISAGLLQVPASLCRPDPGSCKSLLTHSKALQVSVGLLHKPGAELMIPIDIYSDLQKPAETWSLEQACRDLQKPGVGLQRLSVTCLRNKATYKKGLGV